MPTFRVLFVLLAGGLALLGCGSEEVTDSATGTGSSDGEVDFGPLAVRAGQPSGDDGLIEGTLRVTTTCVTLVSDEVEYLLAWPSVGTTWRPDEKQIAYDDGHPDDDEPEVVEMTDGDMVRFGGGTFNSVEDPARLDAIDWVTEPEGDCPTENVWFAG